jgi:hypothetical protein
VRQLHGCHEVAPLTALIAPLVRVARSTNRPTAKRRPPPALLLCVTSKRCGAEDIADAISDIVTIERRVAVNEILIRADSQTW